MIWSTGPHMGNNMDRAPLPIRCTRTSRRRRRPSATSSAGTRRRSPSVSKAPPSVFRPSWSRAITSRRLSVGPALGRVFSPEEDDRIYKGHPAVVLSHNYWMERFQGDRGRREEDSRQQLPDDDRRSVRARVHRPRSFARHPHIRIPIQMKPLMTPGWDAHRRPAQPVDPNVRSDEAGLYGGIGASVTAASLQVDPRTRIDARGHAEHIRIQSRPGSWIAKFASSLPPRVIPACASSSEPLSSYSCAWWAWCC